LSYPSIVENCSYGKCLIASTDLSIGTVVQRLDGIIVRREEIPEDEICYAIWIDNAKWLILKTNARYINHSCSPNCIVDDDFTIKTIKSVKKGEELTIIYNLIYEDEDVGTWDDHWTFKCQCGAKNCQGIINKYITFKEIPWIMESQLELKNKHLVFNRDKSLPNIEIEAINVR
jgi:hypothetical protein